MPLSSDELLTLLEEKATTLQKTQVNLKKCPKQRLTRGYMETKIKSIEEDWQKFKSFHEALIRCTPKEAKENISYFVNEEYFQIEDLYLYLVGDLKDMLLTLPNAQGSHNISSETILQPQVKLPQIHLPTFTGQYDEWPTFNDLFSSLVHQNSTLTKVQKLHYLKSSVSGEAGVLLKNITITDNNYEQAWNILLQRYGNKRLIINSLLKRLFGHKKIATPNANLIKSLLDTTTEVLNSLNNLNVPTGQWDPMIIYLVVQKLDLETHTAWEAQVYSPDADQLPTWSNLKMFLEAKFRTLELITPMTSTAKDTRPVKEKAFHISTTPTPAKNCIMCNELHTLCHCKDFQKLSPIERSEYVRKNNLCYNCLSFGHSANRCRLRVSCKVCNRRHHSMLHQTRKTSKNEEDNTRTHHTHFDDDIDEVPTEDHESDDVAIYSHMAIKKSTALLATALIPVKNDNGHTTILRALIDQGSQANFISERAAQVLKLKRHTARGSVTGVGSTQTTFNHAVQIQLMSRCDDQFSLQVKAYVMTTRLTTQLPAKSFPYSTTVWPHLHGLTLADPTFNQPGRIDLLLGVDVYAQTLKNNVIRGPTGTPSAQETSFGWILFGGIQDNMTEESIMVMHHQIDFDDVLHKLWEIDSDDRNKLTKEEEICQKLYEDTHERNKEGRYIVKLPLKDEPPKATKGKTRDIAKTRLLQLERRLRNNTNLRTEYNKVMDEYINLQHMEEVPTNELEVPSVYLPHHAVVKATSETTKVRVVFNASSAGTNHFSLNDDLMVGPQLQEDMRSLVMRWRLKRVGYVADIVKMYRQILVTKEDANYQRVVWRNDPNKPIKDYRLLRVTFGTASAPYLAVRTMQQVAEDEGKECPEAHDTILQDFFMDDLMSGQDTVHEALQVAQNVNKILNKGGFTLQKWSSNSTKFLKELNPKEVYSSRVDINMKIDRTVRTLGLTWNLNEDTLQHNLNLPQPARTTTKRSILAEIQHVFDPVGWLSPAILPAKLLLQKLWLEGVTWDEIVEPEIKNEWLKIRESLEGWKEINIPRWLETTNETLKDTTVHGFCDASNKAYGAVAYLRVRANDGQHKVGLIAARSRVAPIKPVSLPRLELCGAVLLSKLLNQISEATRIPAAQMFAWTDSKIVISWLRGDPGRWQTFVRNRVVTILDNIGHKWFHVRSADNPADIASRGMLLEELKTNTLWWHGPEWLANEDIELPEAEDICTDLEKRKIINVNVQIEEDVERTILTQLRNFETLNEMMITIVYCKRFLRFKKRDYSDSPIITTEEMNESLEDCVRLVQHHSYENEITNLMHDRHVDKKSTTKHLNPFVDHKKVLRVGGRLRHARLEEAIKHPMIVPRNTALADLIVADAHRRTLHGGVQLTMSYVRSRFWIPRVKSLVTSTVRKCFVCARQKAIARPQMMGDLPAARVTPARPFFNSGVDFAGPLHILRSRGRGSKCDKGYICIFVCMATKAIHLELVGDLSTDSFLGAFRRFVARRGHCGHMWSDRGTNFIGASKELQELWTDYRINVPQNVVKSLVEDGTQWHFNPPYSPNFGGLWEAGVKSIKYHLKRIINKNLTFEEMSTTLCQIEGCLNSRPLCPIDTETDGLNVLTPGHFLIGEAPLNVPDPDLKDVSWNRLSRWQHAQKLLHDFWHRWQTEYLTRLQQRPKWLNVKKEFEVGDIVLVKENNLPPGKWALGRITEKHPGFDSVCRVYSVKSGNKIIKRSVSKLCQLPINE